MALSDSASKMFQHFKRKAEQTFVVPKTDKTTRKFVVVMKKSTTSTTVKTKTVVKSEKENASLQTGLPMLLKLGLVHQDSKSTSVYHSNVYTQQQIQEQYLREAAMESRKKNTGSTSVKVSKNEYKVSKTTTVETSETETKTLSSTVTGTVISSDEKIVFSTPKKTTIISKNEYSYTEKLVASEPPIKKQKHVTDAEKQLDAVKKNQKKVLVGICLPYAKGNVCPNADCKYLHKCLRCWKIGTPVGAASAADTQCKTCSAVVNLCPHKLTCKSGIVCDFAHTDIELKLFAKNKGVGYPVPKGSKKCFKSACDKAGCTGHSKTGKIFCIFCGVFRNHYAEKCTLFLTTNETFHS